MYVYIFKYHARLKLIFHAGERQASRHFLIPHFQI